MTQAAQPNTTARAGSSAYSAEDDPLRAAVPLQSQHVLFPFGFPICIKTNEPSLIRAAEEIWGAFHQIFHVPPIEVRFVVSEVVSRRRPPMPSFRAQANLLTIAADKQNFACCDLAAGFGFANLTKAATTHRDYVRLQFLEPMVHVLLDTQHMVAIHAACLEFQGHGVLLLGDSGAGKSSMAYAAARRGWAYLCDDATSLILHKAGRSVVGNPRTIRFRPGGLVLFPEIKGQPKLRNGKPTVEIRTERLRKIKPVYESNADFLIFLRRSGEAVNPKLHPVPSTEVFRRLSKNSWPEELLVHEPRIRAIERLSGAEAFELEYGEFDAALDLLESTVGGKKS
jgi:HPr Serine kinase C-terminal domain